MRTLALAIAASLCLGSTAANALCTTGVECIRERFGSDTTVRNNRIIDSTDRLGDRRTPENPYLAGQNVAGQARRAGRIDSTLGGTTAGGSAAEPLRPGEVGPDVRYAPRTAIEPFGQGSLIPREIPSEPRAAPDLTVAPYEPAQPTTDTPAGRVGAASPYQTGTARRGLPAAPVRRDRNTPQGAANPRYSGPRTSGAYR